VKKVLALLIMLSFVLPSHAFAGDAGAQDSVNLKLSIGSSAPSVAPENDGAQEAADAATVLGTGKGISAGAVSAALLGAAAVAGAIAAAGGGGGSSGHGHGR
jgi:hypothetical protein